MPWPGGEVTLLAQSGRSFAPAGRTRSKMQGTNQDRMASHYALRAHVEALFGASAAARQNARSALKLSSERDVLVLAGWALAHLGDTVRASGVEQELAGYPLNTLVTCLYLPLCAATPQVLQINPSVQSTACALRLLRTGYRPRTEQARCTRYMSAGRRHCEPTRGRPRGRSWIIQAL